MYLSRDDILAAEDIERTEVECPEWGGTVLVRGLTAQEYLDMGFDMRDIESGKLNSEKVKEMAVNIVAQSVIDEDGEQLFTRKDTKALGRKSFAPIDRISTEALVLSGIREGEDAKN